MARFWKFVWTFTKRWWALMSCAAFTALGLVSALAPNGSKWTVAGTISLAVVLGMVGSFQLWKEQHDRAVSAENELAKERERPPVTAKDWQALADEMEKRCNFFRVDRHWGRGRVETWEMKGGVQSQICEALIQRAGQMLVRSPNVHAQLNDAVRSEGDPFKRWMKFMDQRGALQISDGFFTEEIGGEKFNIFSSSTRNLCFDLVRLCQECAAKES